MLNFLKCFLPEAPVLSLEYMKCSRYVEMMEKEKIALVMKNVGILYIESNSKIYLCITEWSKIWPSSLWNTLFPNLTDSQAHGEKRLYLWLTEIATSLCLHSGKSENFLFILSIS